MKSALVTRIAVTLTFALAVAPYAFANDSGVTSSTVYRGPYLQMATPDGITIVWRTDSRIKPVVRYGASPNALEQRASGDDILLKVSTDIDAPKRVPRLFEMPDDMRQRREKDGDHSASTRAGTYQYEARISGLEPSTKYYYAVYDGNSRLAGGDTYFFRTSPEHGESAPTRIWVVGDSGTGGRDQARVHEAMRKLIADENHPLDMYIHVGDMAYGDGADFEFQEHFFEPYDETLRNVVSWPAMGNHEGRTSRGISGIGPYYDAYVVPENAQAGGVPSGTEAYYSFDVANMHFICLDSHDLDRKPTGAMARWLKEDLSKTSADWLIAFWHHPPYTKGSHDSDREGQLIEMRTHIMPILEAAGVDLVLTGHSHIYERSMLMDGAYDTPTTAEGVILDDGDGRPGGDGAYRKSAGLNPHEGTVQIVAGHGGTGVSRKGTMPVMREIIVEHGSVILDIEGDTMVGRMLDKHDEIRDLFSVVKRGQVEVQRVADPWQPAPLPPDKRGVMEDFLLETPGTQPENFQIAAARDATIEIVETGGSIKRHRLHTRIPANGPYALCLYDDFSGDRYEVKLLFQITPGGARNALGLVFRAEDHRNYYFLRADASRHAVDLVKVEDGAETVLESKNYVFEFDRWHEIELDANNAAIWIEIDDNPVLNMTDESLPNDGTIGIRVDPGTDATIARLEVERQW